MTWTPISGTVPQYSTSDNDLASDYWLKFYQSGTTTPFSAATDSTGAVKLAKIKLNPVGYPISNTGDENSIFIPHVDQDYRIVLYKSEADADADNTSNAAFNIDGLQPQIAPTADASDIALRATTVEIQDDYDRSPLFVDGTDFTAGAGPHVITVPAGWTPSNADTRFYKLDASGIVTPLTPTAKDATTFTTPITLLSTDVLFIGDDRFRNQMDGDPEDIRNRLRFTQSANHIRAGSAQLWSGRTAAPSSVNIVNEVAIDTFELIGKTGSGADYEWAALDQLPDNATAVIVDINLKTSTIGTLTATLLCSVSDGDDPSPDVLDANTLCSLDVDTNVAGGIGSNYLRTSIPVGVSNKGFYIRWTENAQATLSVIELFYRGFLTD